MGQKAKLYVTRQNSTKIQKWIVIKKQNLKLKNIENYNCRAKFVPFYKNVQKEGVILING